MEEDKKKSISKYAIWILAVLAIVIILCVVSMKEERNDNVVNVSEEVTPVLEVNETVQEVLEPETEEIIINETDSIINTSLKPVNNTNNS